jgi:hypothetical protein
MCIRIVNEQAELEFDPLKPLEEQIAGAKQILVNYDPADSKIDSFVCQMQRIVKNGIDCRVDIKVSTNNLLKGIVLERQLDKLQLEVYMNEAVKELTKYHSNIDRRLNEMSEMCIGKINE